MSGRQNVSRTTAEREEIGMARVQILNRMDTLRQLIEQADIRVENGEPRHRVKLRMSNAAFHIEVAVKDYGRLL